ncbi:MAG: tetratricopeptide repeat domain containing protein [Ilumatobacteraceae bacterium]|nr:tetratricopeptide repeat domain containing protein [Ilumatobacteraceae bacterium]
MADAGSGAGGSGSGDAGEIGFGSQRAVRVFVSSTFRDMQAEREELVKRVFPQVRRLCEERGVGWSEVDLRWGVTDEQKAEGAVLPICLAEIDRSRPFFLGLLGQRYGWVPEEMPANLVEQLPWLGSLSGTSVTEMEVLHGVLHDPGAAGHTFFHLRDPSWVASRPPEEQEVLVEADPENIPKLEQLKDRVRSSGHPCQDYRSPQDLGRQVLAELTAMIDELFPAGEVPDAVEREADAHRAFGAARGAGHIDRPQVVAALDRYVDGIAPPLVLHGPPGSDITPLVARWADDRGAFVHHVGATSDASDWRNLAARLVAALDPMVDVALLPDDAPGRRASLFSALERRGTSGERIVLVVDGVELLTDIDGAPDLTWLPLQLPPTVRVIITTSDRRTVDEANRREWPVGEVPPLDDAERRAFIATFLGRWSKGLDAVHVDRLAAAPQTGTPLFLRTVLDELRQWGDHFTLGEVIDRYLSAATVDDLLEQVLDRYEQDFEQDRPGLVGDAMRALWASRRGLTEPELLARLAGAGGEPVPHAVWSPLVLAAEDGLVTRSGMLGFATPVHRRAVEDRYLPTEADRQQASAVVAGYFAAEPLGPRQVEELPWAQLAAGDIDGLVRTISDLAYLEVAYPIAHGDLRRQWARAEEAGRSVVQGYAAVLADPAAHAEEAWAVARLVTDAGHPTEALALNSFLVDHYRAGGAPGEERAPARLRASLVNLGAALWLQGELNAAEVPLEEAVALSRAAGDDALLQAALGNLALARRDSGELDIAVALFSEESDLCRRLGNTGGLQASLGNRAGALRQLGRYDEAMVLLAEQEARCRAVGDAAGLGAALVGQAAIQADRGDPAAAVERFEAYRTWAVEAGDLRAQAEALLNLGNTLRQLGDAAGGAARSAEAEALVRRMGDGALLARVLDGQARVATDEGRWPEVVRLATEAVLTAKAADAPGALVLALGSLGTGRRETGDLPGSAAAHQEELAVATQLGDPSAVATAQVNLGNVAVAGNDLRNGLAWYDAAEPVLRERNLWMVLVPLLNNRWQVHNVLGDDAAATDDLVACGHACVRSGAWQQAQQILPQALQHLNRTGRAAEAGPVYEDLATTARALGDDGMLQQAVGDRALLVLGQGDLAGATALLDEQEEICRRTGNQVGLAACVGNRAIVKQQQGDLTGALACVDEQLQLSRATGDAQGVLFATANRGELLGQLGRKQEALASLQQARQMAAQHHLTPMVQQLDQMIAAVDASQN